MKDWEIQSDDVMLCENRNKVLLIIHPKSFLEYWENRNKLLNKLELIERLILNKIEATSNEANKGNISNECRNGDTRPMNIKWHISKTLHHELKVGDNSKTMQSRVRIMK